MILFFKKKDLKMSKKQLSEIKDSFERYAKLDGSFNAKDWMETNDNIFKCCTGSQERKIFVCICKCLYDLKMKKFRKIKEIKEIRAWLFVNPIFPQERNINKLIIDLAYPINDILIKEEIEYMVIVQGIQRMASYLERWWLPDNQGSEMIISDLKIPFPETIYDLGKYIWDELEV